MSEMRRQDAKRECEEAFEFVKSVIAAGEKYTDPDFPAQVSSIFD